MANKRNHSKQNKKQSQISPSVIFAFIVIATALIACVFGVVSLISGSESSLSDTTSTPSYLETSYGEFKASCAYAEIEMNDGGRIVLELYPDVAPITVANFLKLADEGFYDGLIFHRVISGFMIQGGDPEGTGYGGSDKEIFGEFASNGHENNLSHKRGVISMARSNDPNSASSQFFICHQDAISLDGSYAAFGTVISGMDVVDYIASVPTNADDKPFDNIVIKTIKVLQEPSEDNDIESAETTSSSDKEDVSDSYDDIQFKDEHAYAEIEMNDGGRIVLELYPDVAPITVANFLKLADEGFYDGLIFHRVISGFMIQGGDPEGTGFGGSDTEIFGEFASNGHENTLSHKRGVISMARSNDPNSASSQFFICHRDSTHLDGNYASFGIVVFGLDVVDAIASVPTNAAAKPLEDVVIKTIRVLKNIPEVE